jgi:hypothetical protein
MWWGTVVGVAIFLSSEAIQHLYASLCRPKSIGYRAVTDAAWNAKSGTFSNEAHLWRDDEYLSVSRRRSKRFDR